MDCQAQLPRLVVDRHRDVLGVRVLDRVAQRLAGDAIRLVPDQRIQVARFAVNLDVDLGHLDDRRITGQLLHTERGDAVRGSFTVVAEVRKPCTASRPSVIAASAC